MLRIIGTSLVALRLDSTLVALRFGMGVKSIRIINISQHVFTNAITRGSWLNLANEPSPDDASCSPTDASQFAEQDGRGTLAE
jgi:hypothetical protein